MTISEHARLHNSLNATERYEKVSNTLKGTKFTEEHKMNIGKWSKGKT